MTPTLVMTLIFAACFVLIAVPFPERFRRGHLAKGYRW